MRKAFSMLTAIVVIVLMAGITALVMSLSGKIVSETTSQYRKEQAMLLAKSYTEYAILAIQGHDMQTNECLRTITGIINATQFDTANGGGANNGEGYRITVSLRYAGLPTTITCPNARRLDLNANRSTSTDVAVMVDVNVRYRDLDTVGNTLANGGSVADAPWVNYNRRTLQKL